MATNDFLKSKPVSGVRGSGIGMVTQPEITLPEFGGPLALQAGIRAAEPEYMEQITGGVEDYTGGFTGGALNIVDILGELAGKATDPRLRAGTKKTATSFPEEEGGLGLDLEAFGGPGMDIAKKLSETSESLASSAKDTAKKAATEAAEAGTNITNAIIAEEEGRLGVRPEEAPGATIPEEEGGLGVMGAKQEGFTDPFADILKKAMDGVATARGEKPKMELEDYKEEFAKATGVDISGKVDKSQALMALGLSLMQNKAGRNFNVSNALAALGEAGEKAMPEFAKAKEAARNAQIAAGKYGLSQVAADKAAQATKIAAAQKVVDDLLKSQLDSYEAMRLENFKHKNALQLEMLKVENEAINKMKEGKFKTTDKTQIEDPGLKGVKITMATRESDGRAVFKFPAQEAQVFGSALADVSEGLNAGAEMTRALQQAMTAPGGITGERAIELLQGWGRSIGIGINLDEEPIFETRTRTVKDENGNEITEEYQVMTGMKKNPTPLSALKQGDAIRDRIISQFKRFLTQETGNGISNVDIQNIQNLLGKANFFDDPEDALFRLQETMKIFELKRDKILTSLEQFDDKSRYLNPQEYEDTMKAINDAAVKSYGLDFGSFKPTKDEATGLLTYNLRG